LNGILRGLAEHRAETDPRSEDPRLHGRTYAIPFDDVWQAATRLASGQLRGWTVWVADDQEGVIEASIHPVLVGKAGDVRIRIGLDENAQTRVDVVSATRTQRGDLGRCRRVIARFIRRLDETLDARPEQILDPTRTPAWLEPA
jgi:hypothetical protein